MPILAQFGIDISTSTTLPASDVIFPDPTQTNEYTYPMQTPPPHHVRTHTHTQYKRTHAYKQVETYAYTHTDLALQDGHKATHLRDEERPRTDQVNMVGHHQDDAVPARGG